MGLTKREALSLMKEHGHKKDFCSMCGPMIRCGFCGNNCCNAGHGEGCKDNCNEAYEIQASLKWSIFMHARYFFQITFRNWLKLKWRNVSFRCKNIMMRIWNKYHV